MHRNVNLLLTSKDQVNHPPFRSPSEVVTFWDDSKSDYDFSSNTCNFGCGHYTQIDDELCILIKWGGLSSIEVVWHASEYLGCARVQCGTNYYLSVCNYGPGNVNKMRPYTSGTPCSRCPSGYTCNNNLCRRR
ncbi:GLIPR1-like protein 1 [Crassostrea virginica]